MKKKQNPEEVKEQIRQVSEFEKEELFDPNQIAALIDKSKEDSAETLAESLLFVLSKISGRVQLAPCDAYLADAELFSRIDGVPTDEFGGRQPLLAGFNVEIPLVRSLRISEMFSPLKSCEGGIKARNINTPEQLREIQYLLQKVDR